MYIDEKQNKSILHSFNVKYTERVYNTLVQCKIHGTNV